MWRRAAARWSTGPRSAWAAPPMASCRCPWPPGLHVVGATGRAPRRPLPARRPAAGGDRRGPGPAVRLGHHRPEPRRPGSSRSGPATTGCNRSRRRRSRRRPWPTNRPGCPSASTPSTAPWASGSSSTLSGWECRPPRWCWPTSTATPTPPSTPRRPPPGPGSSSTARAGPSTGPTRPSSGSSPTWPKAGSSAQLLLGGDTGRSSTMRSYGGGPGLDYLFARFKPRLERELGRELSPAHLRGQPSPGLRLRAPSRRPSAPPA